MFLVASSHQHAKALLRRPWPFLSIGAVLLAGGAAFVGVSPILLAAVVIPIIELQLCYGAVLRLPVRLWLVVGVLAFLGHAVLLAFAQGGTSGAHKLAVNLQYVGAVLLGAGLGAFLFRGSIQRAHVQMDDAGG